MSDPNVATGFTRRTAVQAGAIGLLGLGMNHVSLLRAATTQSSAPRPRAKSVIYIFLSGGLSQIDSFDMKPEAPREIRGEFDPIPTRTPGLQICEHLPMLARRCHLWGLPFDHPPLERTLPGAPDHAQRSQRPTAGI